MSKSEIKELLNNQTPTKNIGGQAVIEGVMMRGKDMYTLAVRTPNKDIYTENVMIESAAKKYGFLKWPIIRGMVSFVDSLVMGMKIISKSAEIAGIEDESSDEEQGAIDKFLTEKLGDKLNDYIMGFSVIISLFLSVGIFMVLPVGISKVINDILGNNSWLVLSIIEGLVRICVFVAYIYIISMSKDIKRIFMYHGSEHKTINCYESGDELTVANVRKHTRLHKRCGTSFLIIVMMVSMLFFMFVKVDVIYLRVISRIVFVPFIAGISFEIIKWAGSTKSKFVDLVSYPGLCLQKITTSEPDDDQIEVAIAALKGVLDYENK